MRRRALLSLALPTFALIAVGRLLRTPDLDPAFAFDFPAPVATISAILGLTLVLWVTLRPESAMAFAWRLAAPLSRIPRRLRVPLLAVAFASLGLLLPSRRLSGDAGSVLYRAATGEIYPSNALTDWLTLAVGSLAGLEPVRAVAAVSILSGAFFAWFASGLAAECGTTPGTRAAVLALLLTCGGALLFLGHIEVYAAPAAAMTAYLWLAARRVNGRDRGMAAPIVLGVAFALHGAAGLLLPTLLFLEPGARPRFFRAVGRGLLFLAPILATILSLYFVAWSGRAPAAGQDRFGSFLGFLEQGPLLPLLPTVANLTNRYAIVDPDHLLGVLNLLLLGAPVGLPLAILLRRGMLRDPLSRFAAVATLPFVLFLLVWNVGFPLRYDWDLFAAAGIPLTLLGSALLARADPSPPMLLALVVVSLACFAPRVLTEHGDYREARFAARIFAETYRSLPEGQAARWRPAAERWERRLAEVDESGAEAGQRLARAALDAGDAEEAARRCRAVLSREPDHHWSLLTLGMALRAMERNAEAKAVLRKAVQTDPRNIQPRWLLAGIALEEGNTAEAIDLLSRGVRAGGLSPSVPEVLKLLALLYDRQGDAASASATRRLLDARLRALR